MFHITQWLNQIAGITTAENKNINTYVLNHQQNPTILSAWAKHFREHYCPDNIIDTLRSGTGLTRKQYLEQIIFPDRTTAPGPSIRSGDFGELLVADYLEFALGYWVPRARMDSKAVRNESVKGCDVIGFRIVNANMDSPTDEMVVYECKASLTTTTEINRLQVAVDDSAKDFLRKAEALNFLKRRLIEKQDQMYLRVERFQNSEDRPYLETNGAAAILSDAVFNQMNPNFQNTLGASHPNAARLNLLIIRGNNLMDFVHALYGRAADEA